MNLRRFLETARHYRTLVGAVAILGLLAGVALALLRPPLLSSKAVVVLPPDSRDVPTQVLIAGSQPVLSRAGQRITPPVPLTTLVSRVRVTNPTTTVLAIDAQGTTSAQAEETANAVAESYLSYTGSGNPAGGRVYGRVLQRATSASGTSPAARLLADGLIGLLAGAACGMIAALALSRKDRRLRTRDDIADAIGVPVLASLPVAHPADVASWTELLESYEPAAVHAWVLRKALRYLGLTELKDRSTPLTVLTLSTDRAALALGPQLAVFAASLGIPTTLAIGSQADLEAVATLRAACTNSPLRPNRPTDLQVRTGAGEQGERLSAGLTVQVAVLDSAASQVTLPAPAGVAVLGVSAGAATAEQLARVAVNAADHGIDIAGILVADPERADQTTGRFPRSGRPDRYAMPTRMAKAAPGGRG